MIFELCAETIAACRAARDGGADRIELCTALSEGGLTPSHGLIRSAVALGSPPVHPIIRPRAGGFVYSDDELQMMKEDVQHARALGAAGVVLGVLRADGTVDAAATRTLVEAAGPLEVTFHRAFDATPSPESALEEIIAIGCKRVLTSGGQPDVMQGAAMLRRLHEQAAGRIAIAAGGGLRLDNARDLVERTGLRQIHGSLRRRIDERLADLPGDSGAGWTVAAEDIREMKHLLSGL